MRTAADPRKDQTYFLFGLTQAQLARTSFRWARSRRRTCASWRARCGLAVAEKGESYEICFVPNGDYAGFMDAYLREQGAEREPTSGAVVTSDGRTLGTHAGVHHFTVGQRKGLGIATGEPLYVIATDPESQTVTVGSSEKLLRSDADRARRQLDFDRRAALRRGGRR